MQGSSVLHFRPLVDVDGRVEWRVQTRTELCTVVIDMDKLLGGVDCLLSPGYLPSGATAVQAIAKKDCPAGTSWILPVSHLASPAEAMSL